MVCLVYGVKGKKKSKKCDDFTRYLIELVEERMCM